MRPITRSARVLLVGHETMIHRGLRTSLAARRYDIESATTGHGALFVFERLPPDVIVLDLDLPDIKGIDVCRQVRDRSQVPIIVVSKRTSGAERIAAFDHGADDYFTKPFNLEELLARIRGALRWTFDGQNHETGPVRCGHLTLDFDRRRVWRGTEEIDLSPKEFELLAFFAAHPGRVLTRRTILTAIWGRYAANHPEHLWVLVSQLRKKLESDPANPRYLLSKPWIGYCLVTDSDRQLSGAREQRRTARMR
jgi:two-component system KDP operon response regulator KdpE